MAEYAGTDSDRDGIHAMVAMEDMSEPCAKLRATYARTPGSPFYQREFGFYSLERWRDQGMPEEVPLPELFNFDPPAQVSLGGAGWTTAAFVPAFEEKVIEERGAHEVVQDRAGRHVLFFTGRRDGFMPEYIDHPVKDRRTWEENVKWRLDPGSKERYEGVPKMIEASLPRVADGAIVVQSVIGGYMYLRSLFGPTELLYVFYDLPDLVHDCMQAWLDLADSVSKEHQKYLTIDELFFGEDICYNHGSLISPEMMREFLFPYYQQLIDNIKSRQIDRERHLFFQIDTDGFAPATIPLYQELGMDVMSPFEVASGCDVVALGQEYPDLIMTGGVDKRELAKGREAIDRVVDRIFPAMRARGGDLPTCDHGVPEEVSYEDYLYYRKRCLEFA